MSDIRPWYVLGRNGVTTIPELVEKLNTKLRGKSLEEQLRTQLVTRVVLHRLLCAAELRLCDSWSSLEIALRPDRETHWFEDFGHEIGHTFGFTFLTNRRIHNSWIVSELTIEHTEDFCDQFAKAWLMEEDNILELLELLQKLRRDGMVSIPQG